MKICLLCYRGNMYCGGQGIYLYYLTRELHRQGHEVHVIAGPPFPDIAEGITVHRLDGLDLFLRRKDFLPKKPFHIFSPFNFYELATSRLGIFDEMLTFSIKAYLKIRELLPRHHFDIIHDNQTLGYGLLLLKTLNVPIIATIHHPLSIDTRADMAQINGFFNKMKRAMLYPPVMQGFVARRLDMIITDSMSSVSDIQKIFKVSRDKMRLVYPGVDTAIFSPNSHRKEHQKIIMVGRTDDRKKGVVFLLKALQLLKEESDVNLTIVDEVYPPPYSIAPQLIDNYGLNDRVNFTGRITTEELVRHYTTSEIAVTASIYEGFGLPAVEAMSCQVPIVATTGGALPEVIEHGRTGILVPPGDPRALAEAIKELLADSKARERMGAAGRERAKKHFTWQQAAEKTLQVYREVVDAKKTAGQENITK